MSVIEIMEIVKDINLHIGVLNDDYTAMAVDVGVLKMQVASMIYWSRIIIGSVLVLLITQVYQIFVLHKNDKK